METKGGRLELLSRIRSVMDGQEGNWSVWLDCVFGAQRRVGSPSVIQWTEMPTQLLLLKYLSLRGSHNPKYGNTTLSKVMTSFLPIFCEVFFFLKKKRNATLLKQRGRGLVCLHEHQASSPMSFRKCSLPFPSCLHSIGIQVRAPCLASHEVWGFKLRPRRLARPSSSKEVF